MKVTTKVEISKEEIQEHLELTGRTYIAAEIHVLGHVLNASDTWLRFVIQGGNRYSAKAYVAWGARGLGMGLPIKGERL